MSIVEFARRFQASISLIDLFTIILVAVWVVLLVLCCSVACLPCRLCCGDKIGKASASQALHTILTDFQKLSGGGDATRWTTITLTWLLPSSTMTPIRTRRWTSPARRRLHRFSNMRVLERDLRAATRGRAAWRFWIAPAAFALLTAPSTR